MTLGMIVLATCVVSCSAMLGEGFSGGGPAAADASALRDVSIIDASSSGDVSTPVVTRRCEDTPDCSVFVAQTESPTELILVNSTLFWVRAGAKGLVVEYNFEADGGAPTDTGTPTAGVHDLAFSVYFPYAISPALGVRRYGIESSCATNVTTPNHLTTLANGSLIVADAAGIHRIDCGSADTQLSAEPAGVKTLARGTGSELWWTRTSGAIVSCDGSSATLAACTSSQKVLATMSNTPGDVDLLAVDDVRVFWSGEIDNATIRTKLKTGAAEAPPTVIATGQAVPKVLAPGGNVLYWTNFEGGTLMRAPSTGGEEPTVILTGLNRPWGLVVTSTEIFLAESGAGRILRVKRGTF
jgi:hypothetical protein